MTTCRYRQSPPHASGINHLALALALLFTGAEVTAPVLVRRKHAVRNPTLKTLERRIAELENLTTSQGRELQIQFERIAQLQAHCDLLRIRFINDPQQAGAPRRGASRAAGSALSENGNDLSNRTLDKRPGRDLLS